MPPGKTGILQMYADAPRPNGDFCKGVRGRQTSSHRPKPSGPTRPFLQPTGMLLCATSCQNWSVKKKKRPLSASPFASVQEPKAADWERRRSGPTGAQIAAAIFVGCHLTGVVFATQEGQLHLDWIDLESLASVCNGLQFQCCFFSLARPAVQVTCYDVERRPWLPLAWLTALS